MTELDELLKMKEAMQIRGIDDYLTIVIERRGVMSKPLYHLVKKDAIANLMRDWSFLSTYTYEGLCKRIEILQGDEKK